MESKKLAISFSGGRSSAVMTQLCLTHPKYAGHEKIVCFANTGCEHPATLDFVRDCDEHWGFNTVWLEAVIDTRQGYGTRHRVVDYKTAHRGIEIFDAFCAKYGIPNAGAKMGCTREMKRHAIESYLRSIGWVTGKNANHQVAIGYRADEIDRLSSDPLVISPLAELGWTKLDVDNYMRQFSWDLKIPSDAYGNCLLVPCHKKSLRKLYTIAIQEPQHFANAALLESRHSKVNAGDNEATGPDGERHFTGGIDLLSRFYKRLMNLKEQGSISTMKACR